MKEYTGKSALMKRMLVVDVQKRYLIFHQMQPLLITQRLSFDDFFSNEWVLQGKCKMIEDENMTDLQYQLKSEKQGVQNIDGSRVCFKIHRSSPSSPPRARSRPSPSKT